MTSTYEYKQTRRLASGETKTYIYRKTYNRKGCKFDTLKIKFNDVLNDKTKRPMDKFKIIMNKLTDEEKKLYTDTQIINFIYRQKI
jgi:hypothetical protein